MRDSEEPRMRPARTSTCLAAFASGAIGLGATVAAAAADALQRVGSTPPAAAAMGSLPAAIAAGRFKLGSRARIENVDQVPFARDATAVTLRTRLGWQSAAYRGWTLALEADDLRALDDDSFNSTANGVTDRPVIADPAGTEINVAALTWQAGTRSLALGRQRLNFDNQRFIGNVGFRQNEQTYDGVVARAKPFGRVDLAAAWFWNANRVFGPLTRTIAADYHGDLGLLNARIALGKAGQVALFAYQTNFDNAAAASSKTFGALWTGSAEFSKGWQATYAVSLASQADSGRNPADYSAQYRQLEAGLVHAPWSFKLGQELLSGDATRPNRRFQTPLATLHAFQGAADQFLQTPPQGIDDRYLSATVTLKGLKLQADWHDYGAEASHLDYGSEWNLSATRSFAGRYDVLLKLADYRAERFATDVTKLWLMLSANF